MHESTKHMGECRLVDMLWHKDVQLGATRCYNGVHVHDEHNTSMTVMIMMMMVVVVRMDGWMDGWVGGWMDGGMDGGRGAGMHGR